ncbi:hypothetical protein [Streptomyces sp. NPDC096132]|uniref:hypothetical protein n=1 Tax=Streptomyces sp. NPDC096132 TaxID=3366075 RepID=UPI0037FF6F1E
MTSRPTQPTRLGPGDGILAACRLLADSTTGRAGGLSSGLLEDLGVRPGPVRERVTPAPPVLRIVVLRTRAASGLVSVLTGVPLPDPAGATAPVPPTLTHRPGTRTELLLSPGRRDALDRLARRLLRHGDSVLGTRPTAHSRYETLTWLRVRSAQGRRSFFRTAYTGEDAVARVWRRIQDVTAVGTELGLPAAETLTGVPVTLAAGFAGEPLPWTRADESGVGVTVTDLQVPPAGAGPGRARELLADAHLVVAAAGHAQLAGREPLPGPFRTLLAAAVGGPCPAPVVLVSAVTHRRGLAFLDGLAAWLRAAVPETAGPAARGLPVYAVGPQRARHALNVLLGPQDRDTPAVTRARDAWHTSGVPALCSAVLDPALRDARTTTAALGARRLRAALHDIRLDAGEGAHGAPRTAAEALSSDLPPERLWNELDRFTAVPLARRTLRRLERVTHSEAPGGAAVPGSGPVPQGDRADHPEDSRGATTP